MKYEKGYIVYLHDSAIFCKDIKSMSRLLNCSYTYIRNSVRMPSISFRKNRALKYIEVWENSELKSVMINKVYCKEVITWTESK